MKPNLIKTKCLSALAVVILLVTAFAFTGGTALAQRRVYRRPGGVVVHRPFVRPYGWHGYGGYGYGYPYWYWNGPYYPYYYYPDYPYYDYGYDYDPIAYQQETGYHDGFNRGKSDAKKGYADNPASHKHYYKSSSITYRDAFEQGYADGYAGERQRY